MKQTFQIAVLSAAVALASGAATAQDSTGPEYSPDYSTTAEIRVETAVAAPAVPFTCADHLDQLAADGGPRTPLDRFPLYVDRAFDSVQRRIALGELDPDQLADVQEFVVAYEEATAEPVAFGVSGGGREEIEEVSQALRPLDISPVRAAADDDAAVSLCEAVFYLDYPQPNSTIRNNLAEMEEFFEATRCDAALIKASWIDQEIRAVNARLTTVAAAGADGFRRGKEEIHRQIGDLQEWQDRLIDTSCGQYRN